MILQNNPSFYHWRLMSPGNRLLGIGSLALAVGAGIPLVIARRAGWTVAAGAPPIWAVAGFLVLMAASALLWWAFSRRQDEMFNHIQRRAWGEAGVLTAITLSLWGVLDLLHLAPPIVPIAPLLLLLGFKCSRWLAAVRRCV
jgi:hypothetical protein